MNEQPRNFTLSSGRVVCRASVANFELPNVGDSDSETIYASVNDFPIGVSDWTDAERAEIADYVIAKWTRWKDRAGEFARQNGGE